MRCSATVTGHSVDLRSWRNPDDDPRCRRDAVTDGLCAQHATARARAASVQECQAPRCDRKSVIRVDGHWFCGKHGSLYADHFAIVNRIRSIPARG